MDECLMDMLPEENDGWATKELSMDRLEGIPSLFEPREDIWDNRMIDKPLWLKIKNLLNSKEGWKRIRLESELQNIINNYV